jgi:hypothetical protein
MKIDLGVLFLTTCFVLPGALPGQMSDSGMYLMNMSSGTSLNPSSWAMPMTMTQMGSWQGMFMGQAFVVDTQQTGPRGGDKLYAPNWFMGTAMHSLGGGTLAIESMLSLDPATITNRRYPELFQTGETAYGKPLVDAQHPHDFSWVWGSTMSIQWAARTCSFTMLRWAIRRSVRSLFRTVHPLSNCRRRRSRITGRIRRTSRTT